MAPTGRDDARAVGSSSACDARAGGSSSACDEGYRQIPEDSLCADAPQLSSLLGPWAAEPSALAAEFAAAAPVPHVVIDSFFTEPFARQLRDAFPASDAPLWHVYANPLERKRACSDTARMPAALREAVTALCGPWIVDAVRRITGLLPGDGLQADPFCHGGGLHSSGAGDKLDLHLDYSIHPRSGLERRFNLIVYLTAADWRDEYGGALELWGASPADASVPGARGACIVPAFNRAVLFSTTAPSFHGFPKPLGCPPARRRDSLALYYLTPPRPGAPERSKALYVAAPGDARDEALDRLRTVRARRRLCAADFGGL